MAIRFRKSFKVAPGVRLNVSKSGLSTSIGGKGVTTNLSKKGIRVTTGIQGQGCRRPSSTQVSSASSQKKDTPASRDG